MHEVNPATQRTKVAPDINQAKYDQGLQKDTYLIVGAIALLIVVQGYVVYTILSYAGPAVSASIRALYIVFFLLVISIETVGYWQVRKSLKQHMHEFRYYD
ncbi:monomethylamine permease [Methanolobus chelungpuianus]|uniref:monomethylamine permease n=1 Tax=Methanolobus chelungpuianus TaxID=502115 RepID=UPI00211426D5|nr:monomethylamine permease [Methanolobus chelungpuianus]